MFCTLLQRLATERDPLPGFTMASVTITLSGNKLHHMGREPENAVSSRVAAAMLGVSIYTLQRWCRDGLVPFFRVASGHYRFLRSDIEAMRDGVTNESV